MGEAKGEDEYKEAVESVREKSDCGTIEWADLVLVMETQHDYLRDMMMEVRLARRENQRLRDENHELKTKLKKVRKTK